MLLGEDSKNIVGLERLFGLNILYKINFRPALDNHCRTICRSTEL